MPVDSRVLARAALFLSAGSAVAVLFSIAVSHILLGAALGTVLVARLRLRLPPVTLPLALFVAGTLVSLALSSDPAAGLPQIKKFYVYFALVVLYSTLRGAGDVRRIIMAWGVFGAASALWSFVQFGAKWQDAASRNADFYLAYVASRTTGFMSHWMTFSAEMMMAALMLAALLLFRGLRAHRVLWWAATAVMLVAVVLAWTRGVWVAAAAGIVYLVAAARPRLLLLAPLALAGGWLVAPAPVRERAISIYRPHGEIDSNAHRRATILTGIEMVKAHPWFGLGPEMVGREFSKYVPPSVPAPLPEGFYGHLHNVYLQYAAERGVFTLGALLWFIGKAVADFFRAARKLTPEDGLRRGILHGSIAAILAILVEAFFELNLGDTEVLTMFLAVVACGYIAARSEPPIHADQRK